MNKDKNKLNLKTNYFDEIKLFLPKLLLLAFLDGIVVQTGTIFINSEIVSYKDSFVISIYLIITCLIFILFGGLTLFSLIYLFFRIFKPSVIVRGLLERYTFFLIFAVAVFIPLLNRLIMYFSYYSIFPFANTYYKMAFLMWSAVLILAIFSILAAYMITLLFQIIYNISFSFLKKWHIAATVILLLLLSTLIPVSYNKINQISFHQIDQQISQMPYGKKNNVFLIGIDGATWRIIDPLLQKGELPNFKKLIDNGVRAPIKTSVPTYSPILWTSIATGQKEEKHGIKSFILIFFRGAETPLHDIMQRGFFSKLHYLTFTGLINVYPSNTYYRKTPAIWNILTRYGLSSVVVNWFPSWPAEEINGYMISDRFIRTVVAERKNHNDACQKYHNLVYPDTICEEIAKNTKRFLSSDLKRKVYLTPFQKYNYQSENIYFNLAMEMLARNGETNFFTVYLRGTDDFEHKFWKYRNSDKEKFPYITEEEREKYGSVIDDYYIQVDKYLGEVIEKANENTTIFVISDHGHEPFFTGLDSRQNGAHGLGPDGIFIASGKNIRKDFSGKKPSIYDIAPTILYLLGLPVARDMDGVVLTNIINEKMIASNPPIYIDTYYMPRKKKEKKEAKNKKSMSDEKLMNKLKALGYIN
ncbi:MAG: hypothetical protein D6734_10515, partial [Candidatus Schekmanbacteria bacterium]